MSKIGVEHLCKGCMSFLQYTDRPCPKCGFDEKWFYSGKEYLKVASILNDRYLVGKVLEQNDYELIYIGWDLEANTKVTIRECYLKDIAKRDSTVSNEIILTNDSKQGYFNDFKKNYVETSKRLIELGNLFGIIWTYDAIWCNNTAYIITEHVEYVTLDEYMEQRGGRISVYEVLGFLQPIVYSLALVHEKEIFHGNINLKSIVINSNNDVLLMGFGINTQTSIPKTYKDDIQGICKIIYKIVCGPRFLNNMTCYKETGKLMMPNSVKDYIINALTKGLAPGGNTLYNNITEFYDDIFNNDEYQIDLQAVGFMTNMNMGVNSYANQQSGVNGYNQQIPQSNIQYSQYTQNVQPYQGAYSNMQSSTDGSNQYVAVNNDLKVVKKNSKVLALVAAVAVIMVVVFCKFLIFDSDPTASPNNSQASGDGQTTISGITWTEPEVEEAVRKELGKEDGDAVTSEEAQGIKTLTIRNKGIKNINDLKYCTGLETLTLNNNSKLEDISGLENLTELTELDISSCGLSDITSICYLKKLKNLDVSDNKEIEDISRMNRLTELTTLNLSGNKIKETSSLKGLTNIRTLLLANNQITDLSTLGEMTTLTRLDLADNGITDWSALDGIKRVNGRPYKLNVTFCYQRTTSTYDGWLLHTWRRNPQIVDVDRDLTQDFPFAESPTTSNLEFSFDMVEDFFSFVIYMSDDPTIKDVEANRDIEIGLTKGEVNVRVFIYEGKNNKPVALIDE